MKYIKNAISKNATFLGDCTNLVWIFGGASNVERTTAGQHFVEQHTECPPVHRETFLWSIMQV